MQLLENKICIIVIILHTTIKQIRQQNNTKKSNSLHIVHITVILTTFQNRTWVFQKKMKRYNDNTGIKHFPVLLADKALVYFDMHQYYIYDYTKNCIY